MCSRIHVLQPGIGAQSEGTLFQSSPYLIKDEACTLQAIQRMHTCVLYNALAVWQTLNPFFPLEIMLSCAASRRTRPTFLGGFYFLNLFAPVDPRPCNLHDPLNNVGHMQKNR
jgi:hypothetical protein